MSSQDQAIQDWVARAPRAELVGWLRRKGRTVESRAKTSTVRAEALEWIQSCLTPSSGVGTLRATTPTRERPASEEVVLPPRLSPGKVGPEEGAPLGRPSSPRGNTLNPLGSSSSGEESDGGDGQGMGPLFTLPPSRARPTDHEGNRSCAASGTEGRYHSDRRDVRGPSKKRFVQRDPIPKNRPPPLSSWERDTNQGYLSDRRGTGPPTWDPGAGASGLLDLPPVRTGFSTGPLNRSLNPAPPESSADILSLRLLQRQLDLEEEKLAESRRLRDVQERLLALQLEAANRPSGPAQPAGQGRTPRDTTLIKTKGHLIQP